MIVVLIILLFISGLISLPFALEPLLTQKNWHLLLPWYAFVFAIGMIIAPLLFIFALPVLTVKSGSILGLATIACMVVLFIKMLKSIIALGKEVTEYKGKAHIEFIKRPFGMSEYLLRFEEGRESPKLFVTTLIASRFSEKNNTFGSRDITCLYLPFYGRIFRITVQNIG